VLELGFSLVRGPWGSLIVAASTNPSIRFILVPPRDGTNKLNLEAREGQLETIRDKVAGLDVHRDRVVACCRVVVGHRVKTTKQSFSTMSAGIADLGEWLTENGGSTAVMESTGVLEADLLRPRGRDRRVVAGERVPCQARPGTKDRHV
jgi:hypothetical protein